MAAGCHDASDVTGVPAVPVDTAATYAGFDIGVYPGDGALRAWLFPASPYRWVGYYLAAPCHRDLTWMGHYASVTSLGWGVAAIYVGQQDWTMIPNGAPLFGAAGSAAAATSSASLLTNAQGWAEGAG